MPKLLPDSQADRVRDMVRNPRPEGVRQLADWTASLLEDRDARSALILRLARGLFLARRAIRQGRYDHLDELLRLAHTLAREPWAEHLTCAKCGAPATGSTSPGAGKRTLMLHPDGKACEGGERVAVAGRPLVDELWFPMKE